MTILYFLVVCDLQDRMSKKQLTSVLFFVLFCIMQTTLNTPGTLHVTKRHCVAKAKQ